MRSFKLAILALAVAVPAACPAVAAAATGELIVRFESGVSAAERADIRDGAGTELDRRLPVAGMNLLDLEPGQTLERAERALERQDGVLYAEPNAVRTAALRPADPLYSLLWGMENTGQPIRGVAGSVDADTDTGDAWDAGIGGGVIVAVIDSGMDRDHPDLAPNAWTNPGETGFGRESNGLDDDLNGRIDDWRGWDFVANDSNPGDENGHGTHVAGTIAARRDNSLGVAGVADGSRLMPLRVLNAQGNGSVAGVILAYAYAARAGAKVVNLSLGAQAFSRAEQDAILAFPGMLFVAAAGNGGSDGVGDDNDVSPEYPCAYALPNVLCVAATDNRDRLASFSNYGDVAVDLGAPGVDILSTTPGGGFGWASGTSMATPHVAGAAALLWAASPGASVSQVKSALMTGADPVGSLTGRTVTGARLNVLGSLRLVADITLTPAAPDPAPPEDGDDADEEAAPAQAPPPRRRFVPVGTGAGDATPPHVSVSISRRHRIGRLARRGLPIRVRCSEACTASVRLRAGRGLSGSARAQIAPRKGRRIVVRLGRGARARLSAAAPRSARLTIVARDRAGNRRTVTLSVQLRR